MPDQPLVACHALPRSAATTLAIDIGGSGLKATVLDDGGRMLCDRVRVDTPVGAPPPEVIDTLETLVRDLPDYNRVAVGFPGMIRDGVVRTAPNLGHADWVGFDLAKALQERLGRPVRVANDADVQGLAVVSGRGLEMVVTLGTGFGTAIYDKGRLCPHLEISQLHFRKGETYDEHLGNFARKAFGNKKWQKRVLRAIESMRQLTHFDHLYIGGGNVKNLYRYALPDYVTIVYNAAGLAGGAALWHD